MGRGANWVNPHCRIVTTLRRDSSGNARRTAPAEGMSPIPWTSVACQPPGMSGMSECDRAELIAALDELLETEPTGEQGECPWCEAIRAPWAGAVVADHLAWCPWARLGPLLRGVADEG